MTKTKADQPFPIRVHSWLNPNLCALRNVDLTLALGWLQTGGALAVIQPFRENVFACVFEITLLECRFGLLIFRGIGLLAFVHQDNQSAISPRNKITHLAGLKLSGHI